MTQAKGKPILYLDFDGVIHQYSSAWVDAQTITDDVTPGFFEWAEAAAKYFHLVVYSSRSKEPGGIDAMLNWLQAQHAEWWNKKGRLMECMPFNIEFAHEKPAAFLTIDDRALTFKGDWQEFDPIVLMKFRPWNRL
jgi:hypothetical protein